MKNYGQKIPDFRKRSLGHDILSYVLCGSQTTKIGVGGGGAFSDVKSQLLCHIETNVSLYEVIYKYPLRFEMI